MNNFYIRHQLWITFLAIFTILSSCTSADDSSNRITTITQMLDSAVSLEESNGTALTTADFVFEHNTNAAGQLIGDGTLTIVGIVNSCNNPPCQLADGTVDLGVLVITHNDEFFTIEDAPASFVVTETATSLTIPDQAGAASLNPVIGTIAITRVNDGVTFNYNIIAYYNSIAVTDLIANAGGIENVLPPGAVTITFSTSGENTSSIVSWEAENGNDVLTITNLPNLPDDPAQTGTVAPSSSLLPTGYAVTSHTFTDPVGINDTNIPAPDAITIIEDADSLNSVSYELNINPGAIPDIIISADDLVITITDALDSNQNKTITSGALRVIQYNSPPRITITAAADIRNLNGPELTLYDRTISISLSTAAVDNGFSIDTDNLTTLSDPAGTETVSSDLGTFIASSNSAMTTYELQLVLTTTYNLELGSEILADAEINQPSCSTLTSGGVFTIANDDTTTNYLSSVTIAPINYYYDDNTADNNTNIPVITAGGSILNFNGIIEILECASFAGGTGSADDPHIIDSDMRLDLLSRLINNTSASYNTYKAAYFVLTADIDMSITDAPWASNSTHPNANTNGFIPIGKTPNASSSAAGLGQANHFRGQLDCADAAISNLYISNTNNDAVGYFQGHYIGLFGFLSNNAVITNCTLANATITGYEDIGGFAGFADGDVTISGNTVTNSSITANYGRAGGIAGKLTSSANEIATISANTVGNATITGYEDIGGFAGFADGDVTISGNTVTNSSITANYGRAGGIAGKLTSGVNEIATISANTVGNVTIIANIDAGGIVGQSRLTATAGSSATNIISMNIVTDSSIMTSTNGDDIMNYPGGAGGIAGSLATGDSANNLISNNLVKNSSIIADVSNAGGLVGFMDTFATSGTKTNTNILSSNAVTGGSVTAATNAGGLVGLSYNFDAGDNNLASIIKAFVATTVTASAENSGGIIGFSSNADEITSFFSITDSFFTGTLSAGSGSVGGIMASVVDAPSATLINSYAVATITGTATTTNGLAPITGVTVTHSYYDSTLTTSAADSAEGIRAQSSSQLQTPVAEGAAGEVYESWDAAVWNFGGGLSMMRIIVFGLLFSVLLAVDANASFREHCQPIPCIAAE